MSTVTRTLERNSLTITLALVLALAALLVLSPAEATLGNVVKIVYAHGAAERVSFYMFLAAGVLGLLSFGRVFLQGLSPQSRRPIMARRDSPAVGDPLTHWTRAAQETAILFWLVQFVVSLPAQILAWGTLTWNEPRVAGAIWILILTTLVFAVAHWIGDSSWVALAAIANAVIVLIVLRGSINILHPLNPIVESDSMAIKLFYAAIVITTGALAVLFAHYRAGRVASDWRTSGSGK